LRTPYAAAAPCNAAAGELDPCAPLRLADGRRLQVSPLHRGDADAEQAFVAALSRTSRYRRFHIGWPQLPARPAGAAGRRRPAGAMWRWRRAAPRA
jgi:hypothetical protein